MAGMFPQGFFGTRADLFMDVVITIVVASPLLMGGSWALARRRAYAAHRAAQIALASVFAVVLVCFEVYIRVLGGIDALSPGSPWHQSTGLYAFLAVHLCFAISGTLLWAWLLVASLRRFANPPVPNDFGPRHARWGRVAFVDMSLAAVTGLGVYLLCFVA